MSHTPDDRSKRDRPAPHNPGGCECFTCGQIFIGEEWHTECAVCHALQPDPPQPRQMRKQMTSASETLESRVRQFNLMELPGQMPMMHMGTSYLVNDLWRANEALTKALKSVRGWIDHWEDDAECCLSPTIASLDAAKAEIDAALSLGPKPQAKATDHASTSPGPLNCQTRLMAQGKGQPYPRTCGRCGLGPCPFFNEDGTSRLSLEPKP